MNKENITKEQFKKFLKFRNAGLVDTTDTCTGEIMIRERKEVYEMMLRNFSYLKSKFANEKGN